MANPALKQMPAYQPNEWVVGNVMRWLPIVHQWHSEYPELDPAWILAVIAQESMGEPDVVGGDRVGSVGLMQVAPFAWRPSVSQLQNPSVNIRWGMGILDELQKRYGNLRLSLATYNCGETNLALGHCGRHGGYAYAAVVMNAWLPVFRTELRKVALGDHPLSDWMEKYRPDDSLTGWLASLGYAIGLGKWSGEEGNFWDVICLAYRFTGTCML
jgi:hypothetical protein